MSNILRYEHHGAVVAVDEDLKGKHREHCLCFKCGWFKPEDRDKNCPIANLLFAVCVLHNLTTPVYECPEYEEIEA
jgi:hypothetical protein